MDKNPFDPKRGQKEEEVVENLVEEAPADLPLCDGTLIIGEQRYAMFTFLVEGEQVSKTLQLNDSSNGYVVDAIEHNQVVLKQGTKTHTIKLFFQEAKMENRGGSRKATKRAAPTRKDAIAKRADSKKDEPKRPITKPVPIKKNNDPPRIVRRQESKTSGREKRKDF